MYYVHTDHLGRPQKMTDATATVVWDGVFDPFGNVTSVTGSTTNLIMFPGQYYDSETQLSQNWNRDYDPMIGKYIQSDPFGLNGGINTYSYVLDNPLILTDPMGMAAGGALLGGALGGVLGAESGPGDAAAIVEGAALGSELQDMMDAGDTADGKAQQPKCDCDQLNQDVQNAKGTVGGLGACRMGMTPSQIRQRYYAWLQLAIARAKRDQKCWNGGDPGHQQAQADAWKNVGNCGSMM
jgi:type VI secretion system secreted protein VgrG